MTSPSQDSDRPSNIFQITPLHQPLWFWRQHSRWSHFNRGLFWGGLVSLTSVCSAMAGVALTSIDAVEQQIAIRIQESGDAVSTESQVLTAPLQILLVEVKPDADALVGFSKASKGKSKNILLLEVEPKRNFARAINIPGDTQVQTPEYGTIAVADAYRFGGMDLLSESINRLDDEIRIDRYLRTSPEVFRQLTDSGKIKLPKCDSRLRDCFDSSEQVIRQQTAFETIRQRLNIPGYLASFQTAIAKAEPELDTNLAMPELISVVNFIKELEPERLTVDLLPEYTTVEAEQNLDRLQNPSKQSADREIDLGQIPGKDSVFQNKPVAVQNTTDDPELGRRVVAYLRQRNFRDVYLVRHIPLKLEQTKIVTNYGQVETANYLKNILGFGSLEAESTLQTQELILQLGEDALYLPRS